MLHIRIGQIEIKMFSCKWDHVQLKSLETEKGYLWKLKKKVFLDSGNHSCCSMECLDYFYFIGRVVLSSIFCLYKSFYAEFLCRVFMVPRMAWQPGLVSSRSFQDFLSHLPMQARHPVIAAAIHMASFCRYFGKLNRANLPFALLLENYYKF